MTKKHFLGLLLFSCWNQTEENSEAAFIVTHLK